MTNPLWLLGSLGIVAIEGSYVPQILRLFRLKRAEDVSLLFPTMNLVGRLLALVYSLTQGDHVLAWGFFFGMMLRATLAAQVIWYRWLRGSSSARLRIAQEGGA